MNNDISTTTQVFDQLINKDQKEEPKEKTKIFTDNILKGDFTNDLYTYIHTVEDASEEELIFIVHGVGQNTDKLKNILRLKITDMIQTIYSAKSHFRKQLHIRMIDWKTNLLGRVGDTFEKLLDKDNNSSKFPKTLINQIPVDALLFFNPNHKYNILNDVVRQMNLYHQLVVEHRPLFKGNVSIVSHSLGACIMYDILTNMCCKKEKPLQSSPTIKRRFTTREFDLINDKNFNIYNSNCNFNQKEKKDINYEVFIPKSDKRQDIFRRIITNNNTKSTIKLKNIDSPVNSFIENNLNKFGNNSLIDESIFVKDQIFSKNPNIYAMEFKVNHFFLLGSPLSLFLTIENGDDAFLDEMETVKDFHNIMHPHDPISYRIEPKIMNFPTTPRSFVLPHWENDGIKHKFWQNFVKVLCCIGRSKDDNNDRMKQSNSTDKKRYDFMLQESPTEKAVNIIGFIFSHQSYWNNHDVFYFIINTIHWHGYQSPDEDDL